MYIVVQLKNLYDGENKSCRWFLNRFYLLLYYYLRKCIYLHTQCMKCKNRTSQEEIYAWLVGGSGKFWRKVKVELTQHRLHIGSLLANILFGHYASVYPHATKHLRIWKRDMTFFLTLPGLIGRHKTHFNFLCKVLLDYTIRSTLRDLYYT